eukprot:TRINITY_DN3082_c0_g1_i1.p2 TRINITY_DN3082_c0_g1~~TRINITY_DN3082_c0_g1_i1.p2  ORF type:complete len:318 (+),score=107.04 TRINITY_DN3082_c0_g1_i1:91-954(+)
MAAQCQVAIDDKVKEAVAGKVSAAPGQKHSRHYECSICINPAFDTPVRATCGHLYHQECLEHWLQGKVGDAHCCPDCRKELPPGRAAFTIDFVSKSVLDEVEVECPQDCAQSPAAKRMRFDVLGDHVRMHCPNTNLICSGEGCGAVLPRLQMIQGHLPSCQHVLVLCKQCGSSVKRGALQEHMTRICSHREVPRELQFQLGDTVMILGSHTRPEYNGARGEVRGFKWAATQRYIVVDFGSRCMCVRATNLFHAPAAAAAPAPAPAPVAPVAPAGFHPSISDDDDIFA